MTLHVGNKLIKNAYYGRIKIGRAYYGSKLVYGETSPVSTFNYIFRDLSDEGELSLATGTLENASQLTKIITDNLFNSSFKDCTNLIGDVSFPNLTEISGISSCESMFYGSYSLTSVSMPKLTTISGRHSCYQMFRRCTAISSISLQQLTTISGEEACKDMFDSCNGVVSVEFPSLTTITGERACSYLFGYCADLSTVSFTSLNNLNASGACEHMFDCCTNISNVYFPALTEDSFGDYKDQFVNMLMNTGAFTTHTLHFPTNMKSVIEGLEGYPLFGGQEGSVSVLFDIAVPISTVYYSDGTEVNPATIINPTSSDKNFYNAYSYNSRIEGNLTFQNLQSVSVNNYLANGFMRCDRLSAVSFPALISITGDTAFDSAFSDCSSLSSASFPNLTTISGSHGIGFMFYNCTSLESVSFQKLNNITGSEACRNLFHGCTSIKDIYFPALTTSSFGSMRGQFTQMLLSTGMSTVHTIHFPSNLELIIQELDGYPGFGANPDYCVLAFDLPATE